MNGNNNLLSFCATSGEELEFDLDAIDDWVAKVKKLIMDCEITNTPSCLVTTMNDYLTLLKGFEGHLFAKDIFYHLYSFNSCYRRFGIKSESYLSEMEEMLVIYCEMEFFKLTSEKAVNRKKQEILNNLARRMIYILSVYLLDDRKRLLHVLMRMNVGLNNPSRAKLLNSIFINLVMKDPDDMSDEMFCRYYLLMQKWKPFRSTEYWEKMDNFICQIFNRSSKFFEENDLMKKILAVQPKTDFDDLITTPSLFCQMAMHNYWNHVNSSEKTSNDNYYFKDDNDINLDDPSADDTLNDEEMRVYNELSAFLSDLRPYTVSEPTQSSSMDIDKEPFDDDLVCLNHDIFLAGLKENPDTSRQMEIDNVIDDILASAELATKNLSLGDHAAREQPIAEIPQSQPNESSLKPNSKTVVETKFPVCVNAGQAWGLSTDVIVIDDEDTDIRSYGLQSNGNFHPNDDVQKNGSNFDETKSDRNSKPRRTKSEKHVKIIDPKRESRGKNAKRPRNNPDKHDDPNRESGGKNSKRPRNNADKHDDPNRESGGKNSKRSRTNPEKHDYSNRESGGKNSKRSRTNPEQHDDPHGQSGSLGQKPHEKPNAIATNINVGIDSERLLLGLFRAKRNDAGRTQDSKTEEKCGKSLKSEPNVNSTTTTGNLDYVNISDPPPHSNPDPQPAKLQLVEEHVLDLKIHPVSCQDHAEFSNSPKFLSDNVMERCLEQFKDDSTEVDKKATLFLAENFNCYKKNYFKPSISNNHDVIKFYVQFIAYCSSKLVRF